MLEVTEIHVESRRSVRGEYLVVCVRQVGLGGQSGEWRQVARNVGSMARIALPEDWINGDPMGNDDDPVAE